eukprot:4245466-Pyramimonas_sp.AAC.1
MSCAISATGESVSFGDGGGYVHLWSSLDEPRLFAPIQPPYARYAPLSACPAPKAMQCCELSIAISPAVPKGGFCTMFLIGRVVVVYGYGFPKCKENLPPSGG